MITAHTPRLRTPLPPCARGLERHEWRGGVAFRAYGAKIGVRVNEARLARALPGILPTGAQPLHPPIVDHLVSCLVVKSRSGAPSFRLFAAARPITRSSLRPEALRILEGHLERAVSEIAPGRLFVHAGVVGWKGRAIVIPGTSYSGKSSLVRELLKAGATYLSDEYAVFDRMGRVHPYPRPLVMRRDGRPDRRLTARALGASVATRAMPVGLIAVTRYDAGARWRPEPLSPGEAVLEMLAHTVAVRKRPRDTFATLGRAARGARAFKTPRGEARAVARLLLEASQRN